MAKEIKKTTSETSAIKPTTPIAVPKYGSDVKDASGKVVGQAKFDPNTGKALPVPKATPAQVSKTTPKVSDTTISNVNKKDEVPGMVKKLDDVSNKNITTDAEGNQRYSDGSFVEDDSEQDLVEADTSEQDKQSDALMKSMKKSLDAGTKTQIDMIQRQFAQRKAEQAEINARAEKGTQTALLMGGVTGQGSSAQYAPISSGGIVQAQESYGLKQIADLDFEEQSLIMEANEAKRQGNYKLMETKLNQIENTRTEKIETAKELNKTIMEQNKKIREENLAYVKDGAISELYTQGITDTNTIIKTLKEQGIKVSSKDISDTLKNSGVTEINDIMKEASKNGAPLSVINAISNAKSPAEAIMAAGEYTADVLDRQYKKAQIAKIYQDISDSGTQYDPMQLVAYAQQYASTGTIPTGIPKGSFGMIAQAAKEMPKSQGQIIDRATGVTPDKLGTAGDAYGAVYSTIELAKQLKELDKERVGGVISGTVGKIFGSKDQQRYIDLRNQMVDLLARARSGAALTASEEKRYASMLPGRTSEAFFTGADSELRIDNFISTLESDLNNKVSSKGWVVYGVTPVETPIGVKKVGETTTSPDGISYRINADGTLTQIQ